MELSEMLGVERGKWFKVLGFDYSLFRIIYDECKKEELQIKYPEKIFVEPVTINMLYAVIRVAPSGIIHLPPPLTDEQREQLKALYTIGYRWLVKDKYGPVYAYEIKPCKKTRDTWLWEDGALYICCTKPTECLESLVSWPDTEPLDIAKALEVGE